MYLTICITSLQLLVDMPYSTKTMAEENIGEFGNRSSIQQSFPIQKSSIFHRTLAQFTTFFHTNTQFMHVEQF